MQILAHRGIWKSDSEKNSKAALSSSLKAGFGVETDIRDRNGQLVISHDPAIEDCWLAADFFALASELNTSAPLALNIKSDGLHRLIQEAVTEFRLENYFCFDMSFPDLRQYSGIQLAFFCRLSEYETMPQLKEFSKGVWLDAFDDEWYLQTPLSKFVSMYSQVAIVSPELHKRKHDKVWQWVLDGIGDIGTNTNRVMLCTDYPFEAKRYFEAQGIII